MSFKNNNNNNNDKRDVKQQFHYKDSTSQLFSG